MVPKEASVTLAMKDGQVTMVAERVELTTKLEALDYAAAIKRWAANLPVLKKRVRKKPVKASPVKRASPRRKASREPAAAEAPPAA
jgi:hypothetical protein